MTFTLFSINLAEIIKALNLIDVSMRKSNHVCVRVNVRHAEFHNILTSPSIPILILLRVQSSQLLELNTDYLRLD